MIAFYKLEKHFTSKKLQLGTVILKSLFLVT
jgi:hypothetical protein